MFSSHVDLEQARTAVRRLWPIMFISLSTAGCSYSLVARDALLEEFVQRFGPAQLPLRALAIVGGVALLFVGWKIYRFVVALPGFFVGAVLGAQIGYQLSHSGWIALIACVLVGILGVWLALGLHDLAVFAIGALGGTFLAGSLWAMSAATPVPLWLEVVAGIVGGVLLLAMARTWMMLLSAAVGATMLVWGIQENVLWILVFFVLGIGVQFGLSRALGEKAFEEQQESP
ncbi:MAG: DUF4203 domain-containing protein [Anaerolineales bacterium]|nr:DUF4203 domain-containing protein [Anaerolineales bacterium]